MGNNASVKEASTSIIVTKTAITIKHLAARLKPRSPWNCEVHFASGFAVKMRGAMISAFAKTCVLLLETEWLSKL